MDKLAELLHEILALLPWRAEADKLAAHDKVEAIKEEAAPVGRNATAPGVVKDPATDGGNAEGTEV